MAELLHPQAQQYYDQYLADPPQSLLLIAPVGSGKDYILRSLAGSLLGDHPTGRLFELAPEAGKKSISIDAIRELKVSLRLKSPKKRVILIPQAGLLTTEAQNSLLKLIEEPPKDVHFLLAATNVNELLDTIQSRVTVWNLALPLPTQIREYYANYPEAVLAKAIAIGESRMGLIEALLTQQDTHSLVHAIDVAKEILSENHFKRMIRVDALAKDPVFASELLDALRLVCNAALINSAKKDSPAVKQWHKRLKIVMQSSDWLVNSVQPKLVLSYLFMQL